MPDFEKREEGVSCIDGNLLNGLSVEERTFGQCTIAVDRSLVAGFKEVCWNEFKGIEKWIREEHRLFNEHGMRSNGRKDARLL